MAKKSVINPGKFHLGFTFDFPPYQNEEYNEEHEVKQLRWKASCIMNRRAYVGNVKITEYDGSTYTLSDSVFKSRTNKFDSFTKTRRIDVAVGDGEDIIALAGFADMLLQFKQTTLHIINCAGASEFLEGTYKFKGVDHPSSVCNTDFGIAWANKHGVFFFDGRQVEDCFIKRGVKRIKASTWSAFTGSDILRVGYLPDERLIIIINDDGDTFVYDMTTKSFTQGTTRVTAHEKTNLINIWNGTLVMGSNDGTGDEDLNVKPIEAVASATDSANYYLLTRQVDGTSPTQEKKWKKVYVTYRNAGSAKVELSYKGISKKDGESAFIPVTEAFLNSTDWKTTGFKIGVNAYTMQIEIKPKSGRSIPKDFEINDITLVYRDKSVK